MKLHIPAFIVGALLTIPHVLKGQEDIVESFVELSPFTIDAGVSSTSIVTPAAAYESAPVPISITKRADAVAVQILLVNAEDKQEVRNTDLYKSIVAIQNAFASVPGFRVEQREIRFAGGNRKYLSSFGKSRVNDSYTNIVVFGSLPSETTTTVRLKFIRDTLQKVTLAGTTKATDGVVGLYIKNPNQYRREIIDKIFDDIRFLKERLGPEFELHPSGFTKPVSLKVSGEAEIELWIDYSFYIASLKELMQPKKI